MHHTHKRPVWRARIRKAASVIAVSATAVVGIAATSAPAGAAGLSTTLSSGLYNCGTQDPGISPACLAGALSDFNAARAKEGLGPLVLPGNFTSLDVPTQLLVLTNIDRTDRGLAPMGGISPNLSALAQVGANNRTDPAGPSNAWWGANWASTVNSLWTEFIWMYEDGPGGSNYDCTATVTSGCWGHRNNILHDWGPGALMGVGVNGTNGDATLYVSAPAGATSPAVSAPTPVASPPATMPTTVAVTVCDRHHRHCHQVVKRVRHSVGHHGYVRHAARRH